MTTYREIIYLILDLVKGTSDDFSLNENHISFLLNKYKGYLLSQKYAKDLSKIDPANFQTICIDLTKESDCDEVVLKSTRTIPNYLGTITAYAGMDRLERIENSRFKYAGSGKFGKRMKYFTIMPNRELYIKSKNSQLQYLKRIELSGVFVDEIPAEMNCSNNSDNGNQCYQDPMDSPFIIEQGLIVSLIQAVLNDIMQAAYRPMDGINNGRDDLPDIYSLAQAIARSLRNNRRSNDDSN